MNINYMSKIAGEEFEVRKGTASFEMAVINNGREFYLVETSGNDTDYPLIEFKDWTKEEIKEAIQQMSLFGFTIDEPAINEAEVDEITEYIFNLKRITNEEKMENLSKEDICRRYNSLDELIEALDSCYDLYDLGYSDQITQNNYIELSEEKALEVYRIFKKAHGDPNFQFEPKPFNIFKVTPWEDRTIVNFIQTNATPEEFRDCIKEAKEIEAFDLDTVIRITKKKGHAVQDITPDAHDTLDY